MKKIITFIFLILTTLVSAVEEKIGFLSDVHFHDVYANFEGDFDGLLSETTGKRATIRTMDSQMNSTRLFNENYFAFLAVLDELAKENINKIVISGDFSDDGQKVHIEGLKRVMKRYKEKYGMDFYVTLGNHDPNTPFTRDKGKEDYLGENGKQQPIYSKGYKYKEIDKKVSNDVILSNLVKELGYEDIMNLMKDYGFFPKKENFYWATPFSKYSYSEYSYEKALKDSNLKDRTYEISKEGSGNLLGDKVFEVIDGSYVVEPIEGVWLLAIDSNVYIPKEKLASEKKDDPNNFEGSGNAGYNKVLTHKKHLLPWIKTIVEEAEKNNKTLITFSHFPMIEFYNEAEENIAEVFGEGKFELKRIPKTEVSKELANLGIKLHFAGHMHFNDTNTIKGDNGNFLINLQVPSIAAYIPAYKVLTIKENGILEVETKILKEVPRFNELFEHYQKEYDFLSSIGKENIWNREILNSKDYYEFASWHLKELVRLRFIPQEWPKDLSNLLLTSNLEDMLILSQLKNIDNLEKLNLEVMTKNEKWSETKNLLTKELKKKNITLKELSDISGTDFIADLYCLRNASQLADFDVSKGRVELYEKILEVIEMKKITSNKFNNDFYNILIMINKFANDKPSQNFVIDLRNGVLEEK